MNRSSCITFWPLCAKSTKSLREVISAKCIRSSRPSTAHTIEKFELAPTARSEMPLFLKKSEVEVIIRQIDLFTTVWRHF